MRPFTLNDKIDDMASAFPYASSVFKHCQADVCSSQEDPQLQSDPGAEDLSAAPDAADVSYSLEETHPIDGDAMMESLVEAYDFFKRREGLFEIDWQHESFHDLIHHIIAVHHEYLRRELPALEGCMIKLKAIHGQDNPSFIPVLQAKFKTLQTDLEGHLSTEEQTVFPLILRYEQTGNPEQLKQAWTQLTALEADHQEACSLLKEMRMLTADYQLPEGACRTLKLTYQKLEDLEADMRQHIHLEDHILFARLAEQLNR
ncbi:hemerythrin domain-containing protein [Marinicrinis sediminis]|uniref:Hemerythrin domain-containing protein n=1 Tax=Marinicrinis sediminis TaxID=1652465 RepID=A0ABW5RA34_9BACL